MSSIAVVDLGTGNLHSVAKAIEHVSADCQVFVTNDANLIEQVDRVVLPGQGAIGSWMAALEKAGLKVALREALESKPVLGICLGLQALYPYSEEDGGIQGLDVLNGQVRHFLAAAAKLKASFGALKVPHMGWNNVDQTQEHPLWRGIEDKSRFYFVHSYVVQSSDTSEIVGATNYGVTFTAAAARHNIFAVQFHPEKSQHAGLQLLSNFVAWDGNW
ncbi:imidazole glycerol phosphate synthase subunit HisH [Pseudomonadota bacterium]